MGSKGGARMYLAVTHGTLPQALTESEYARIQEAAVRLVDDFSAMPGFRAYYATVTVGSAELITVHVFEDEASWTAAVQELERGVRHAIPGLTVRRSGGEVKVTRTR